MTGFRIGLDVGGTNTDAVILNPSLDVVASVKRPTTVDARDGVSEAIAAVLKESRIEPRQITHAMLGTTHCTNAIVERKGLSRVGVLRLGAPATTAVPPFTGWPDDLRDVVDAGSYILPGGNEVDGREISPLDMQALERACDEMRGKVDAIAIVGVYSPVDPRQEETAAEFVHDHLGVPLTISSQIGSIGLLERENATILNVSLKNTLQSMAYGFINSLEAQGIQATPFFGQNDGTLMSLEYALEFPVLTIGCGPTNSIRGAAHLSGTQNALVVDIGGTTTDIGVLSEGFPRQSSKAAEIGGIRTNSRMPDVLSFGLGGGSIVGVDGSSVGPDSVGYRISKDSLAFGGRVLTATDVSLAVGVGEIPGVVAPIVDPEVLRSAWSRIQEMLADAIDQMKPSAEPIPVVLVGGGGIIAPSQIKGASEIIRPEFYGAANAVGAALGEIAGQAEKVYQVTGRDRRELREEISAEAVKRAILAGADPGSVQIISIEEVPSAYSDGLQVLIRARAVGKLLMSGD